MDADSTEAPSSPGYSIPIRAPLTIDSDSEFCLSANDHIYSRTSSFTSTSSSIGISSHDDEQTCVFEEYPDKEIVIERSHVDESCFIRPFVRYPDANYVKERCGSSESTVFRPFVKTPCEENSNVDFGPFGFKPSVPIAPLTGDSESDSDSINGDRWDDSGWIPADGLVQKVTLSPKVTSFIGVEEDDDVDDESRVESVFSGDDMIETENLNSVSTESVECLNEIVKVSGSGASSLDLERLDALTVSSSTNEIETKLSELDDTSSENLSCVSVEVIENEVCKVKCLNEVVKVSESGALSIDLEKIDALTVSSSTNEIDFERKLSEADELSFDSERISVQIVSSSDSEIENLNSVSTESIPNEECKVDRLNEVLKLSESDASSLDLEKTEAQTAPSSNNEIEIKTINESEQEVVNENEKNPLKKMQRVRTQFLRLAFNEQLTTKVNREGGSYNFDFALTILAIGKTGVGKSATINSIFGENKATTNAFDFGTTTIQEIIGNVDGIQLRVIDTPGLKCSFTDRSYNQRVLNSIKRFIMKHTPNVVLYVDRLDSLNVNDSHLLKMITSSLGSSVWQCCIIGLTHAGCDLSGEPLNRLVVQRCRFLQEQIVGFGGDNRHVANPVWLVENHPSYNHDVMDLGHDIKGLVCLHQADEDDGCDKVQTFEPLSEPRAIINRRGAYLTEHGCQVTLVGSNHWSFGVRLFL